MYYYCKYCGTKAPSVFSLTCGSKCVKSPNSQHALYEGSEQSQYTCKFCGNKASSIFSLTCGSRCIKGPGGLHEPVVQGSLQNESDDQRVSSSGSNEGAQSERAASDSSLPSGCYGVIFAVGLVVWGGQSIWERFNAPDASKAPSAAVLPQVSEQQIQKNRQELLEASKLEEEKRQAASEMISRMKKAEIDQIKQEEQVATRELRIMAEAYPRTPEIHRQSYLAQEELGRIQREYGFKYEDVRKKYEAIERNQQDHFLSADELAASMPKEAAPQAASTLPALKAIPVQSEAGEPLHSVVGINVGDTLNVRLGAGANYEVVARLPNGASRLRIVGEPIMNGSTEWVQIVFGDRTGWVVKSYLRPE